MTHPAEGPETAETIEQDAVERLRRENLAQAERIILGQPPASWMPCFEEGPRDAA